MNNEMQLLKRTHAQIQTILIFKIIIIIQILFQKQYSKITALVVLNKVI